MDYFQACMVNYFFVENMFSFDGRVAFGRRIERSGVGKGRANVARAPSPRAKTSENP